MSTASLSTSPRNTASSPPRSIISSPMTTTTTSQTHHVVHQQQLRQHPPPPPPHPAAAATVVASSSSAGAPPAQTIYATLPSTETQRDIASARNAVVASLGNMVDTELESRATVLHENAAALDKQERDVLAATAGLRREREKLAKEADGAARKIKELGNVQNWAEVLERQFLVLEETVRLANGGKEYREGEDDDDDASSRGGSYCSCSCSDCDGDDRLDETDGNAVDGERSNQNGARTRDDTPKHGVDSDHTAKRKDVADLTTLLDDAGLQTAWSDTSRSLDEPDSSTGTGMARGSDTGSLSTDS